MIEIYKKIFNSHIEWRRKDNDHLHNDNGPALEYDSVKEWFQNGVLHRTDGPAIEFVDGTKEYWLNNEHYPYIKTDEEWIIFQIIN